MANEEHFALLSQGVGVWNEWRYKNRFKLIILDLSGANLSELKNLRGINLSLTNLEGTNLSGVNLRDADLSRANLRDADLSGADLRGINAKEIELYGANLTRANLSGLELSGVNLYLADLEEANLSEAILEFANFGESNLKGADLRKADLILARIHDADLRGANLSESVLIEANISHSDLSGANLSRADLERTNALNANFSKAIFTGACIKDWHINQDTNLDDITCDYIYLGSAQTERRPNNGNFAPGEFTKVFQKVLETVDLIFGNGINWQAFQFSFQKLQVECAGEELTIQAIENKNDGVFVIRVNVPPDANKAEIEKFLKREYESSQYFIEEKYRDKLQAKDNEIEIYRQQNANLNNIVKLLAEKPINNIIEVNAKAQNEIMSDSSKYNFSHAKFGGGFAAEGGTQIGGTLNDYSFSQDLSEAATQIQQFLIQLQAQGYTSENAQQKVASDLAQRAKNDPTFNKQLPKLGQYLVNAAANGLIGEAAVKVVELAQSLL